MRVYKNRQQLPIFFLVSQLQKKICKDYNKARSPSPTEGSVVVSKNDAYMVSLLNSQCRILREKRSL